MTLCVGSSTAGKTSDYGLRFFSLDEKTGQLKLLAQGAQGRSPTYVVFGNGLIYGLDERQEGGALDAYAWKHGEPVKYLGGCELPGGSMCHLTLLPGGQYLTVSSYGTGSQIICKLDKDGIPASMSMLEQHEGVGFDSKDRQDGPHVHFSAVAPGNDRILVTDLGLDSVSVYRLDDDNGVMIKDIEENQVYTEPGSGPRHLTFSADGRFWYLVTELNSHVLAFSYDKATGRSNLIEEKPMLPHGFDKYNIASDIHLSPDGKFLYAANRGLNDVVCYSVDAESGSITLCGRYGIHCSMPRTFAVSEKYLVAAGQGDNKVVVLPRDCTTGALSDAVCELSISGAAYVGFFPDFC